jgi:UDP-glucose 4-epimerase
MTNTIGPRMRVKDARQTFVGVWIKEVLTKQQIKVWGGAQLRDFTYVDDAVEAFLLSAVRPAAVGAVYNLGGVGRITLKDLAGQLVQVAGQGRYVVQEFPSNRKRIDIGDFQADGRLIESALGWRPRTTIQAALRKTVEFYRRELKWYL